MKTMHCLVLSCLLPAVALAQHPEDLAGAPQPTETATAFRAFVNENGAGWQVHYNAATGTPKAIYGPGLALGGPVASLDAARLEGSKLLTRYSELLGKGGSDFVEVIGVKANKVYVLVYDQKFKGLPVITGRADVRINENGVVAMFGSAAVPIPAGFNIRPLLTAKFASAKADELVLAKAGAAGRPMPRLVIWADTEAKARTVATLAWEVQIDERPAQVAVGKAYIDAATGALLQFKNEVFDCSCGRSHVVGKAPTGHTARITRSLDLAAKAAAKAAVKTEQPSDTDSADAPMVNIVGQVFGWTNKGHNPFDPLVNVPLPNVLVTSPVGNAYTDASGKFTIVYAGNTSQLVTATLTGRHSKRIRVATGSQLSASLLMVPGVSKTIQIGASNMGQLDRSQTTTYWYTDDCNTWLRGLLGASPAMTNLSNMDPRVNINSSCNAYYTNYTINFYNESTTCNMTAYETVIQHEWGHGADHAFGGITQTDGLSEGWGDILAIYRSRQPIVGPNFQKSGGAVRSALNNRTFPAGGGSHQQGETWMGFAWDLRGNLMTTLGAAAGEAKAIDIVVKSIAADAKNQPDAVREVFILDDDDGNLNNGTPNYLDLEKAAIKRSLPYPKIGGGGGSSAKDMVYYNFDTGAGTTAVNRASAASTPVTGSTPWVVPGRYGPAMLRGSDNASATNFNYVESDFKGPITGDLTIHWWMKERVSVGTGLSYVFGGLGNFRGFTNGVAGTEFWVRNWGGADLKLPTVGANLQTRARAAAGVCVTLTVDGTASLAQWYIDGAPHGAAIAIATGASVAAVANGFRIGKHTSDTSSSAYDLDEFRMVNRVATPAEIQTWCDGPKSLYYKFDRGIGDVAVNYGDDPAPSSMTALGAVGPWVSPGHEGNAMLRGSSNSSATDANYCDTGFNGPIHGSATIHWWMKQRVAPGTALSYVFGGIGSFRCFTNGVAGTGLWVRNAVGADIQFPGNIQTLAQAANGVCVGLSIDAAAKTAQWYINGAPSGAAIAIPGGINVAAGTSAFKIGKHTSDLNSSVFDIDEFRFENRCVSPVEIRGWCANPTADSGVFGKQCGIELGSIGGNPTVGNANYGHTITATPAAATRCLFVIGVTPTVPFDMGIAFPALAGCPWFTPFDVQLVIGTAADGTATLGGGIPNVTSLAGLHVGTQVLGFQGTTPLQSNAVDHTIEIR